MAISDTIARAETMLQELGLPRDVLQKLGVSVSQITRRIQIDQITSESGELKNISVDEVNLGSASIDAIHIKNMDVALKGADALLTNVRSITELEFFLDWEVDLGFLGSWSGSDGLGSLDIPLNLGNVSVPDLSNIKMSIPAVDVPGVDAQMKPIKNLALGKTGLDTLKVLETRLPSAGFQLSGMGVGSLNLAGLQVPAMDAARTTVQAVTPENKVTLPGAKLQNLKVPSTSIPDINSGAFGTSAQASARSIGADLGILDVSIRVVPTVFLNVGSMTIQDVALSANAKEVALNDITLPLSIKGVQVDDLQLQDVRVNEVSL